MSDSFDTEKFEERAAIYEYDGGYSRQDAERLALNDVINERRPQSKQAHKTSLAFSDSRERSQAFK